MKKQNKILFGREKTKITNNEKKSEEKLVNLDEMVGKYFKRLESYSATI